MTISLFRRTRRRQADEAERNRSALDQQALDQQALDEAIEHQRAHRLAHAGRLCEKVLQRNPASAPALHRLGLITYEQGDREGAAALIRRAIWAQPQIAHFHCDLGVVLESLGRLDEAIAAYDAALRLRPHFITALNNRAIALRATGRLADAAAAFAAVIRLRPEHPTAHNDLGAVLLQSGRPAEALVALDNATRVDPDHAGAHLNRARALEALARVDSALSAYAEALRCEPAYPPARLARAALLRRRSRYEEALADCEHVVQTHPGLAEAHFEHATTLEACGRHDRALAAYDAALALRADFFEAKVNRANVLRSLGRLEDALAGYDRALTLAPGDAETLFNRADLLFAMGRYSEALEASGNALRQDPTLTPAQIVRGRALHGLNRSAQALAAFDAVLGQSPANAEAHFYRANVLRDCDRLDEALIAYDRAILHRSDFGHALNNRGTVLQAMGKTAAALADFDAALAINPDHAAAHANRANVLMDQGQFTDAAHAFEAALRLAPDLRENHSNYLSCLNYDPTRSDEDLLAAHRHYGARHGDPTARTRADGADRDPDRPLRIGLVSADLGRHPVGYLVQPLMEAGDPETLRFHCYSGRAVEDDLSERLRGRAASWRRTQGLSDTELAAAIETDGIDILIDLSGHTAGNRLGCFALRPAPIQVHWCGYAYTTGLPAIDYALWDDVHVPAGSERWFTETVVRLPLRWCYAPPDYAPAVDAPPVLDAGSITFGSFNNLTKLVPEVIETWSQILAAVPDSRLLLSWRTLADATERDRIHGLFATHGVDPERIELTGGAPTHAGVLAQYSRVDIALDPFPYSGGLTTLEALWMGVPVVTLPASRPVSRQSASMLTALGRSDWIAGDHEAYVRLAINLAADPARLAAWRRDQRARMAASPLCDGPRFARSFENAMRAMWQTWCDRPTGSPTELFPPTDAPLRAGKSGSASGYRGVGVGAGALATASIPPRRA